MKNIFLTLVLFISSIGLNAQTFPLRTFTELPQNAYLKDTNNELIDYEGTWKGTWDGKTFYITFKKITNKYNPYLKYYSDFLIGKFKVLDSGGQILFDNTSISDDNAKINGSKFRKIDDKYSLSYLDPDLCSLSFRISINFTDATKTKLQWKAKYFMEIFTSGCPYINGNPFPQPIPKNVILIKQ